MRFRERRARRARRCPPALPDPAGVAIFGPTGVAKTAVPIALSERLTAPGADPVALSPDALPV